MLTMKKVTKLRTLNWINPYLINKSYLKSRNKMPMKLINWIYL